MNKTSAKEWLIKSYHNLSSAEILLEAGHFTDIIGTVLHLWLEMMLKAFLAYENKKIKKTHDLLEITSLITHKITFNDDEKRLLVIATNYHLEERYPSQNTGLPEQNEIKNVLNYTNELFDRICGILKIEKNEVINENR